MHRWIGTALQFQQPDGSWGKLVNLKGDRGVPGGSHWYGVLEQASIAGADGVEYDVRMNVVSDTVMYVGEALPGTATSAAAWRVKKVVSNAEGDLDKTWEGGTADFDKVWDDYASL